MESGRVQVRTLLKNESPVNEVSFESPSGIGRSMSILLRSRREGSPVKGSQEMPAHPMVSSFPHAGVNSVQEERVVLLPHALTLRLSRSSSHADGAQGGGTEAVLARRAIQACPNRVPESDTVGNGLSPSWSQEGKGPHRFGFMSTLKRVKGMDAQEDGTKPCHEG